MGILRGMIRVRSKLSAMEKWGRAFEGRVRLIDEASEGEGITGLEDVCGMTRRMKEMSKQGKQTIWDLLMQYVHAWVSEVLRYTMAQSCRMK